MNKKNIKELFRNNKTLMIITIVAMVCIVAGITYSLYQVTLEGRKQQQITTGELVFSYNETSQGLSLTGNNAFLNDTEGKAQTNYFGFDISLNSSAAHDVDYYIYLIEDDTSTLTNDYVKVYLTDASDNQIVGPSYISNLTNYNNQDYAKLLYNSTINTTADNNSTTKSFRLRAWIDKDKEFNYTQTDNDGQHTITMDSYTYKFKVNVASVLDIDLNLDESGANAPDLATGMIPVYYDSTNDVWRKADSENKQSQYRWYSYTKNNNDTTKGMWANAVTVSATNRSTYLNAALGTAIPMSDINTMFVWIPRFNAVTPSNYNGGTQTAPGAINVTFVDTNTTALDAFWWDENNNGTQDTGEQKSGFWFAKFETTGTLASACTTETCNVSSMTIKPNITSLTSQSVSSFFYAGRSMEQINNPYGFVSSEVDTHMLKNNEWGAVAYLTQSIYGRCTSSTSCTEVTKNDNSSYITGGNAYKTNVNQSTTGTIYGIYDMSGGAEEYIMGNYNNTIGSSGFSSMPASKYYNLYTGTSYTGHALTETAGWYSDIAYFVSSGYPWFKRGGDYGDGSGAGVFSFDGSNGGANSNRSSRLSIVK